MKFTMKIKLIIKFLIIIFILIKKSQSTVFCPSKVRCMDETRLNCNNSLSAPTDFHCCDGLQCVPAVIPATDTQNQLNTTMCVASSSKQRKSKNKIQPSKTPPIMASSWSAATTYYNMSNGDTGWGYFWYDASHQAIRTDFYPICPFLQLYEVGIDANYIPCSVLFYQGQNYYVYPGVQTCCNYTFPAWQPDWLCQSNATFNGTVTINGRMADFWMIEWFSNFTGGGPVRNIRNMYTQVDSHIPIRFREDLDTGYLDFHDYVEGPIDQKIFTSVINGYSPCHQGHEHSGNTDKTCTRYNSQTLRRSWPCDNPTCS
ncbi:unnamed protein product [Rotaria sordida]|uniref:Uncharacterized protein n=1 Tax=Rotaria sordida TaxID=392033 RepID=A0A814DU82_9BILA|nr:unnamed protein product [Rotaria sordida]CAF1061622.1 unnamed protein product [Rotaria sordida]CAF3710973.1 unnamed protein product [Rotaria sordida]CAF3728489.1 unnamed protein product [Rotaria sordida]